LLYKEHFIILHVPLEARENGYNNCFPKLDLSWNVRYITCGVSITAFARLLRRAYVSLYTETLLLQVRVLYAHMSHGYINRCVAANSGASNDAQLSYESLSTRLPSSKRTIIMNHESLWRDKTTRNATASAIPKALTHLISYNYRRGSFLLSFLPLVACDISKNWCLSNHMNNWGL